MPYRIRKVNRKPCYRVSKKIKNKTKKNKTKIVFSKCTSRKKAENQVNLLNAIHYNKNFVPRAQTVKNRK
jgi:hypothetical protein